MGVATGNPTWVDYPSTTTPISATALNNQESVLDRVSVATDAQLGSNNTTLPACEYRLTTAYSSLPSGDYVFVGNMSAVSDPLGMVSNPSTSGYRVTVPRAGRYEILLKINSGTAGAGLIGHVTKNVPVSTAASTAVVNYCLLSNPGGNANNGSEVNVTGSELLAANDWLNFYVYAATTFSLPVTVFTGIRTKFVVRYTGPN